MFNTEHPWFKREPLTQDQMKSEIASSKIKDPEHTEFSKEAIHGLLKELNLTDKNTNVENARKPTN